MGIVSFFSLFLVLLLFLIFIFHHFNRLWWTEVLKKRIKKKKKTKPNPINLILKCHPPPTPTTNFGVLSFKFIFLSIFFKILFFLFPIWHIFHQLKKKKKKKNEIPLPTHYNFEICQDPKILGCTCYARKGTTRFTSRLTLYKHTQILSHIHVQSYTYMHTHSPIGWYRKMHTHVHRT